MKCKKTLRQSKAIAPTVQVLNQVSIGSITRNDNRQYHFNVIGEGAMKALLTWVDMKVAQVLGLFPLKDGFFTKFGEGLGSLAAGFVWSAISAALVFLFHYFH